MVKKMITTIKERRWMKEKENGNRLRTRKEIKEFGGILRGEQSIE